MVLIVSTTRSRKLNALRFIVCRVVLVCWCMLSTGKQILYSDNIARSFNTFYHWLDWKRVHGIAIKLIDDDAAKTVHDNVISSKPRTVTRGYQRYKLSWPSCSASWLFWVIPTVCGIGLLNTKIPNVRFYGLLFVITSDGTKVFPKKLESAENKRLF